jgi:hypothetical protein
LFAGSKGKRSIPEDSDKAIHTEQGHRKDDIEDEPYNSFYAVFTTGLNEVKDGILLPVCQHADFGRAYGFRV